MSYTITQIVWDDFATGNAYTGPSRELRVDTDNWDILVHDGATPGGHRIQNQYNADQRYQQTNPELQGIGPFTSSDTGYLARIGEYSYALRSFTASAGDIAITNPDGQTGATNFSLASTLPGNYEFSGSVTFDNGITATGGLIGPINGNVTGNLTGNVTGNITGNGNGTWTGPVVGNVTGTVTGNVTGNLTGNVTGNCYGTSNSWATSRTVTFSGGDITGSFTIDGSSNVGGIALALANLSGSSPAGTYQNATITVDAKGRVTGAVSGAGVLSGSVIMWVTAAIPSGWFLCNGQAISRGGNPNLAAVASAAGYSGAFGPGDGSTTFNVPDMRGLFTRMLDQGAGVDPEGGTRSLGSLQAWAFPDHRHAVTPYWEHGTGFGTTGSGTWTNTDATETGQLMQTGSQAINAANIDTEVRPINMAINWIIKGG